MAKSKITSVYVCRECGFESSKWLGKCAACGAWNSMSEEVKKAAPMTRTGTVKTLEIKELSNINAVTEIRIKTGIGEFDRVLCGGLAKGSLVLMSGEPGIGKSTLMLQAAKNFSALKKVLYVSGEESETQIKMRADRLGLDCGGLFFMSHFNLDEILPAAEKAGIEILIIDSIQTMQTASASGSAGSVSQVRECCMMLMEFAKTNGISVIITGHVTKDGNIAGPRILEHMVDCVMYFEGERFKTYRILRSVKNRFGSTNEIGVFEMTETGLKEVKNPSMKFLDGRGEDFVGSSIMCTMEGTRPLMVELQALVTPTGFGTPRRMVSGLDYNRMVMILAVIEKKLALSIQNQDIYINVAGGLKIGETAVDLAVVLAVLSAVKNKPLNGSAAAIGELGLTGETRFVTGVEKRLAELEKMGFKNCILPAANKQPKYEGNIKLHYINTVDALLKPEIERVIYARNNC